MVKEDTFQSFRHLPLKVFENRNFIYQAHTTQLHLYFMVPKYLKKSMAFGFFELETEGTKKWLQTGGMVGACPELRHWALETSLPPWTNKKTWLKRTTFVQGLKPIWTSVGTAAMASVSTQARSGLLGWQKAPALIFTDVPT